MTANRSFVVLLALVVFAACTRSPSSDPSGPGGSGGAATGVPSAAPDAMAAPLDDSLPPALDDASAGGGAAEGSATPATGGSGDAASDGAASSTNAFEGGAPTSEIPLVTDQGATGTFQVTTQGSTGPDGNYTLYYPTSMTSGALEYPSLVWGNGALATPSNYTTLLDTIASNGIIIIEYDSTPDAQQMTDAIDWLVAQNTTSGSVLYGHVDMSGIVAGGHSAGSLAAFAIAADPRLVTTVHLSGGTMSPHTDLANLRHAALFVCGDMPTGAGLTTGDVAEPNCEYDFENATVPVFYGMQKGASHLSTYDVIGDDAQRTQFARALIGWLGWKAAGQAIRASMFVGASCALCTDPAWTVQERGL